MLCDFGLTKMVEDVPGGLTTRSSPDPAGRFTAPEIIFGASRSLASDIWAWGCLLLVVSPPETLSNPVLTIS